MLILKAEFVAAASYGCGSAVKLTSCFADTTANDDVTSAVAIVTSAVAIGFSAVAICSSAVAICSSAVAFDSSAVAFGFIAVAIGFIAVVISFIAVAIFFIAVANTFIAVAIGFSDEAIDYRAVAFCFIAVAIGYSAVANSFIAVAITFIAVAIGFSDEAIDYSAVAIGSSAVVLGSSAVNFGSSAVAWYHSDLVLAKTPGVSSDWKPPPFCNEQDHLWRHVWKVTDGASKLAFKMGEVSVLRKRAALITPEAMDRAQPLMNPETPTGLQNLVLVQLGTVLQMRGKELHALKPKHFTKVVVADTPPGFKFVVDPFACKNHQGGLRGANNPPEPKEVVPNSNTIRVGNQLAEAKSCPVVALDLLLNKLPADAAGLFIKPNPAYEVSGKWYCNQKVGEHSLKSRVSSMFDTEEESFTSHSMKRTGAAGVADFPDAFRQSMGGWADPGSMKSYTVHGTAKRGQATAAMMAAITPSDVAVNSSNATHVSASTVVAAHVGGGVESMQMQQMHQLQQASIERMMKRMKRMERNMGRRPLAEVESVHEELRGRGRLQTRKSWEDDDGNDCGNDPDIGVFDLRMFRDASLSMPGSHVQPQPQPQTLPQPQPPIAHDVADARNSKERGEDGLGLKFSAQAFKHRFTRLAHCLKLYHSDLVLAKTPGVSSDWKPPPFCNEQDHLWRHVWKVTDGASKLAFKMGEVSVLRKRAALITPEAMDRAQPLMNPETPTGLQNLVLVQLGTVLQMRGKELHALKPKHFTKVVVADTPPGFKFVVDPFACKNHQGGLRGANNPPEPKEVVPNSNTIRVGNQLAEAKSCPVVALDLLLNKLPADAAGLFIKPNPAYEVSGKWYCNQKVGEHSLKSRVSSMFDTEEESFTSHSMKRTGATGVADFPDAFRQSMGGWADPGSMKSYTVHGTAKRGQATAAMMAAITPSDVAVNSSNATHVSASTVVAAHVGGGVEVFGMPGGTQPFFVQSVAQPSMGYVGHHLEAQMQSMQGNFAMMQSMQMQQMHQLQQASIERMMKRMKRMERNMSP
ncbi:hypothetical protein QJQ45_007802 [Haematococcus lacustris]|nr:hypothetical protein QJQ45_007802 [Haematococcus lacustris]